MSQRSSDDVYLGAERYIEPDDDIGRRRDGDLADRAEQLYLERRHRRAVFAGYVDMFGEPGWDILLDLYIACRTKGPVSISSACLASDGSVTTALRWIDTLARRDLIMRSSDPEDGRRSFLSLTDAGVEVMERYLRSI